MPSACRVLTRGHQQFGGDVCRPPQRVHEDRAGAGVNHGIADAAKGHRGHHDRGAALGADLEQRQVAVRRYRRTGPGPPATPQRCAISASNDSTCGPNGATHPERRASRNELFLDIRDVSFRQMNPH